MNFIKRDQYGNQMMPTVTDTDACSHNDKPMNADADADSNAHKKTDELMLISRPKPTAINVESTPDTPINDNRIESFMCMIVEDSLHGMQQLIPAYKKCGFNIDKPIPLLKNDIRQLLSHKRIKERLRYMRDCEWEINKPDPSYLCKKLNDIMDEDDLAAKEKISAINSLAKLTGMLDNMHHGSDTKVAVIFNTQEKPPIDVKVENIK